MTEPPAASREIRVALAGAGVIASPHMASLRALESLGVHVEAVCDLDEAKARTFQRQHKIPRYFSRLEEMLEQVAPDVVHILVPAFGHADASALCLEKGSHIFVEKPFCVKSAECTRIAEQAKAAGLIVGVNHNLTYMPAFEKALYWARSGRLGAIESVRVQYHIPWPSLGASQPEQWMFAAPGNLILELGPHPLSLICRLLGPVRQAASLVGREAENANGTAFYRSWQSSLLCERGAAQVALSLEAGYAHSSVHLQGEDGEVYADLRRNRIRVSRKGPFRRSADWRDAVENGWSEFKQGTKNLYHAVLGTTGLGPSYDLQYLSIARSVADFYSALRARKRVPAGAAEGTMIVEACEAVIGGAGRGENVHA